MVDAGQRRAIRWRLSVQNERQDVQVAVVVASHVALVGRHACERGGHRAAFGGFVDECFVQGVGAQDRVLEQGQAVAVARVGREGEEERGGASLLGQARR